MTRAGRTAIGVSAALAACLAYRLLSLGWPEGAAVLYGRLCIEELIFFGIPAVLMRPWRSSVIDGEKRWYALLFYPVLAFLTYPVLKSLADGWANLVQVGSNQVYPLPENFPETLLMALALVIVPAICEEAFFRGAMLCGLIKGLGRGGALWLTALLFALMHMRPGALPFHIGVGLLTTLAMLRTGRVWVPMLMHAAFNALSLMNI